MYRPERQKPQSLDKLVDEFANELKERLKVLEDMFGIPYKVVIGEPTDRKNRIYILGNNDEGEVKYGVRIGDPANGPWIKLPCEVMKYIMEELPEGMKLPESNGYLNAEGFIRKRYVLTVYVYPEISNEESNED